MTKLTEVSVTQRRRNLLVPTNRVTESYKSRWGPGTVWPWWQAEAIYQNYHDLRHKTWYLAKYVGKKGAQIPRQSCRGLGVNAESSNTWIACKISVSVASASSTFLSIGRQPSETWKRSGGPVIESTSSPVHRWPGLRFLSQKQWTRVLLYDPSIFWLIPFLDSE